MSFETSQVDVRFVLAVFMFPRFAHIHLHLTFVEDYVSVHPALHVCLSSARAHITPIPPDSGSDDMLSSRDVFLSTIDLLRLLSLSPSLPLSLLSLSQAPLLSHSLPFSLSPPL
jgi:hypothetical protein